MKTKEQIENMLEKVIDIQYKNPDAGDNYHYLFGLKFGLSWVLEEIKEEELFNDPLMTK